MSQCQEVTKKLEASSASFDTASSASFDTASSDLFVTASSDLFVTASSDLFVTASSTHFVTASSTPIVMASFPALVTASLTAFVTASSTPFVTKKIAASPDSFVTKKLQASSASIKVPVKYGELIVLGYNGLLPNWNEARTKSHFALFQRPEANGVKPSTVHVGGTPQEAETLRSMDQRRISYTVDPLTTVVVEYTHDENTDMFQIGRFTETPIDFVVKNTVIDYTSFQNGISRFACRIVCQRSPPYTAHIYAAGFDSDNKIVLGEESVKWKTRDGQMDGLTTNGVLVMRPLHGFTQDSTPGPWREISVCGKPYALRKGPADKKPGEMVDSERQELADGSLIGLCGVTLLWRTAEGLARTPTTAAGGADAQLRRPELNAYGRPWCPLVFSDLPFPVPRREQERDQKQPCGAYLKCGHVDGYHGGSDNDEEVEVRCPTCRVRGPYVPLQLGCEEAFFLDGKRGRHAFVPCGHVCSEETAAFWSQMPLPGDMATFPATSPVCPFCFQRLTGDTGYVRLIKP